MLPYIQYTAVYGIITSLNKLFITGGALYILAVGLSERGCMYLNTLNRILRLSGLMLAFHSFHPLFKRRGYTRPLVPYKINSFKST
jgi:hypothetical protein